MNVLITLNAGLGANLGPTFNINSNGGAVSPGSATLTELLSGTASFTVPDGATQIYITSLGSCGNVLTLNIAGIPTVPPTLSPTTIFPTISPTTTITPTLAPTAVPTVTPTATPTSAPTVSPTGGPTVPPTTATPTVAPTLLPTVPPTATPTAPPVTYTALLTCIGADVVQTTSALGTINLVSPYSRVTDGTNSYLTISQYTGSSSPWGYPFVVVTPTGLEGCEGPAPTVPPTDTPTSTPTVSPTTITPTSSPTVAPTITPTITPTDSPTTVICSDYITSCVTPGQTAYFEYLNCAGIPSSHSIVYGTSDVHVCAKSGTVVNTPDNNGSITYFATCGS